MVKLIIQKSIYCFNGGVMEEKLRKIIKILTEKNKTISTMESCTGGALVCEITNIEGSSNVLKYSAVTYSNEFKIKMGVDKGIIEKYSVYSKETAREMSRKISDFTGSNYSVGITGKLNKRDDDNDYGKDNEVFISIYNKDICKYYDYSLIVKNDTRKENKEQIVDFICDKLIEILN